MSQTHEICTTHSRKEQQLESPALGFALPSLLYRRKKALEESHKFHKAEITRLQSLLSATETQLKEISRGLEQVELSVIKVEEDIQIYGERNAHSGDWVHNIDWMHNIAEAALSQDVPY
ncbi:hypothetical protein V495_00177 [Pseudogymnoascus sp. VKM F-4514 (FW-929)]|nr:hypothetical protein V495_00177 [Pseudogymnoascus sp. VKM F-4514 (FW-929)]KFY66826.1 hypothetical protein V497_00669 [Pseudogymnoascus sp. VKM F-4516 (FW-969)]